MSGGWSASEPSKLIGFLSEAGKLTQTLVAALVQAEELGANISETLVVQAEQLRVRRHQVAEEKARKAPVKMLIPLVGFMFPAMFVVLLAPAILQIGAMLHGLSQH